MTVLAAFLAGLSAWLFLRPPAGRSLRRRLKIRPGVAEGVTEKGRLIQVAALVITVAASLALARGLGGTMWLVLMLTGWMISGTVVRLGVLQIRSRRSVRARGAVAHACAVLASQCRIGAVPTLALATAAQDCPILEEAAAAQRIGGDVVRTWRRSATLPGQSGLADLARAWQVSLATGAELADALDQVSAALDADEALGRVVRAELAAPRATGRMLAVLPMAGLGLGYLIGGDPLAFLLKSAYGWACLLLGAGLACAGVLWIERLSHQTAERF